MGQLVFATGIFEFYLITGMAGDISVRDRSQGFPQRDGVLQSCGFVSERAGQTADRVRTYVVDLLFVTGSTSAIRMPDIYGAKVGVMFY